MSMPIHMEKTKEVMQISQTDQREEKAKDESNDLLLTLPKHNVQDGFDFYLYQGLWYPSMALQSMLTFQKHFQPHNTDLILATSPKSGATWLKALVFAISTRTRFTPNQSPLLTTNAHELVPFLELDLYMKNPNPNLHEIPKPRLLSTHSPYSSLPVSIKDSGCRVVYFCRNPLDQFISYWLFTEKLRPETMKPVSLEESSNMFLQGISTSGPFWDHVLEYWKASNDKPDKVLFLKFEDMKEDTVLITKMLAEFLGFPFSAEEEQRGLVEEISKLCSFGKMKDLEVNKKGKHQNGLPNDAYIRKGDVRDWANYLTPEIAQNMKKLTEEKLGSYGLAFKFSGIA